jgi:hypothetical protein
MTDCDAWEKIYVTVEESMYIQVDYDLDVLYTGLNYGHDSSTFVNGCSVTSCGTVTYDVTLERSYSFTQISGIPLTSGTDTYMTDPKVTYINWDTWVGDDSLSFD